MRSFVYIPSTTVEPPRQAACNATLAERRTELWACASRSSKEKKPCIILIHAWRDWSNSRKPHSGQSVFRPRSELGTSQIHDKSHNFSQLARPLCFIQMYPEVCATHKETKGSLKKGTCNNKKRGRLSINSCGFRKRPSELPQQITNFQSCCWNKSLQENVH